MSQDIKKFVKHLIVTFILLFSYLAILFTANNTYANGILSSLLDGEFITAASDFAKSPIEIYNSLFAPDTDINLIYPDVYKSSDLPIYDDGTLIGISPESPTEIHLLRLKISTNTEYTDVVDFYDTAFAEIDWQVPNDDFVDSGLLVREYSKDNTTFTISGSDIGTKPVIYKIYIDYEEPNPTQE